MVGGLLESKVALVTGCDHPDGIGIAIARMFSAAGARVAVLGLNEDALSAHAAELPGDALGLAADITSRRELAGAVARVGEQWGRIDIVVCNAGIVQTRRFDDIDDEDLALVLDVNVGGTMRTIQAADPWLADGGSVITVGSIAAQRGGGLKGGPHYAASKGAIWSLTKTLAREFAPRGIRANTIHPGVITTRMTADVDEATTRANITATPLGRLGTPADIAGAALYLASDLSAFVTGEALAVNGGLHIS